MTAPIAARTGNPDRRFKRKTHCPKGHAYSEQNTLWAVTIDGNPYQQCKTCRQIRRNKAHKLKYRNDPVFREKKKQITRDWRDKQKDRANEMFKVSQKRS